MFLLFSLGFSFNFRSSCLFSRLLVEFSCWNRSHPFKFFLLFQKNFHFFLNKFLKILTLQKHNLSVRQRDFESRKAVSKLNDIHFHITAEQISIIIWRGSFYLSSLLLRLRPIWYPELFKSFSSTSFVVSFLHFNYSYLTISLRDDGWYGYCVYGRVFHVFLLLSFSYDL